MRVVGANAFTYAALPLDRFLSELNYICLNYQVAVLCIKSFVFSLTMRSIISNIVLYSLLLFLPVILNVIVVEPGNCA